MENPFDIVVYDKDMNFAGFVVDPIYCNFVPAWKSQGYGSFMLTSDNPHTEALQAKGARVTINYLGEHVMSGPIRSRQGDVVKNTAATYQVLDDKRILENTLLWVNPSNPLYAATLASLGQAWRVNPGTVGAVNGQSAYFRWPDGSADFGGLNITSSEGAIKHAIRENVVTRLGRNVTIAPDLGRGGNPFDVLPTKRFVPLSEVMTPLTEFSGLGITLRQYRMGSTIVMDVVEPGVWDQELTPESGIVLTGTYSVGAPNITRAILGGPGETAARLYSGIAGSGNVSALESEYNDVIEVFRDATSAPIVWPESVVDPFKVEKYYPLLGAPTDLLALAKYFATEQAAALAEGPATSGLALTLSETDTFHYGGPDGIQLGDTVTVKIDGQRFVDQVTSAQMVFTRDKGLVISPLIGERADDPDAELAKAIAGLAKALRTMSAAK